MHRWNVFQLQRQHCGASKNAGTVPSPMEGQALIHSRPRDHGVGLVLIYWRFLQHHEHLLLDGVLHPHHFFVNRHQLAGRYVPRWKVGAALNATLTTILLSDLTLVSADLHNRSGHVRVLGAIALVVCLVVRRVPDGERARMGVDVLLQQKVHLAGWVQLARNHRSDINFVHGGQLR